MKNDEELTKIILDKVKRSATSLFPTQFFLDAKTSEKAGEVLISLGTHIAAKILEPQLVRHPRTWWDAFKYEVLSPGIRRRFRIKVRWKNYDAVLMFPKLIEQLEDKEKKLINYLEKEFDMQPVFIKSKEDGKEKKE